MPTSSRVHTSDSANNFRDIEPMLALILVRLRRQWANPKTALFGLAAQIISATLLPLKVGSQKYVCMTILIESYYYSQLATQWYNMDYIMYVLLVGRPVAFNDALDTLIVTFQPCTGSTNVCWQNILAINAITRYVRIYPGGSAATTSAQCASTLIPPNIGLTLASLAQRWPNVGLLNT